MRNNDKPEKRILLIAPPFYRLMGSHYNGLHLGISYIGAVLKKHGHHVGIYNADYLNDTKYIDQRQLYENYAQYKTILGNLTHPIWGEVREKLASFMPDFVGITMWTANYKAAKNIAVIAKSINGNIKVVVGGAHPSLDPDGTLAEEEFDYVIRGEGEFALLELVDGQEKSEIAGLSFKKDKRIIHNNSRAFIADLDSLPFPTRDSFVNEAKNLDLGHIITGRGCPYSCSYCASPKLWNRTTRLRSVANVMEELDYLVKTYHPPIIHFADDTFTMDRDRAKEICQRMIDRHLDIKWVCDTRVDRLDDELLALMKKAGCVRVKIGAESGSDKVLHMVHKGITSAMIRKAVSLIQAHGLSVTVYLMTGFPGETDEDLRQTIKMAKELKADYYSLSVLAPYYGTGIWYDMEKSGKKLDREHWEYFYHQSQDMIVNSSLDPKIIKEFFALNELGNGGRV